MAVVHAELSRVEFALHPRELEEHWPGTSPLFRTTVAIRLEGRVLIEQSVSMSSGDFAVLNERLSSLLAGQRRSVKVRNLDDDVLIAASRSYRRKYVLPDGFTNLMVIIGQPVGLVASFSFAVRDELLEAFLREVREEERAAYPENPYRSRDTN